MKFINLTALLFLIFKSCKGQKLVSSQNKEIVQSEKPNLIIIQTDEHNFRTISAYQKYLILID